MRVSREVQVSWDVWAGREVWVGWEVWGRVLVRRLATTWRWRATRRRWVRVSREVRVS
jgi:hypothetical protein